MSTVIERIKEVEKSLKRLLDSLEYSSLGVTEVKELIGVADKIGKSKTSIESLLGKNAASLTASALNIPLRKFQNLLPIEKAFERPIPAVLMNYDPVVDTLVCDADVTDELRISPATLLRWRRNWYSSTDIGFPPPVIYVYGSPRWTKRQIEWWLNDSNEKVFIKGRKDE